MGGGGGGRGGGVPLQQVCNLYIHYHPLAASLLTFCPAAHGAESETQCSEFFSLFLRYM